MDFTKNILVFPCGSEVALEIYRSLEHSTHFNLIGASSVDDHGQFVYKNYIGGLPFVGAEGFLDALKEVADNHQVDAIYPATDSTIAFLKRHEAVLEIKIISSETETTEICLSKSKTYQRLKGIVPIPFVYANAGLIDHYPVFLKPDIGYGSRGVKKADDIQEVVDCLNKLPANIILEYLPGKEYTIDCFTNFNGELLFIGPRERKRIGNGISVNSATMPLRDEFKNIATKINGAIKFSGAWFFQVKERADGELVLMEIASRLAGTSGVYRAKGINFASLSLFNAFNMPVEVLVNNYEVEVDRALNSKYRINLSFDYVYIDFDDTIIVKGRVNAQMVHTIYHFINLGKKVYLLTKHKDDIYLTLKKFRLEGLFDNIIAIKKEDDKWRYISHSSAIYIDDSFMERKHIRDKLNIPVFDTDTADIFWQMES